MSQDSQQFSSYSKIASLINRPHLFQTKTGSEHISSESSQTKSFQRTSNISTRSNGINSYRTDFDSSLTTKWYFRDTIIALSKNVGGDTLAVGGKDSISFLSLEKESLSIIGSLKLQEQDSIASISDIKWGRQFSSNRLASSATNGNITIWDTYRFDSTPLKTFRAHDRAVNRIAFSPYNGHWLLSASQDGLVRLWDTRDTNEEKLSVEGKSESVRDVKFNPSKNFEFACASDNGVIQLWDLRNTYSFLRKINGHSGFILTIDFREDGKFLASGGRDKLIKVWDLDSSNAKARHSFQSYASVRQVSWRPSFNQIAACAIGPKASIDIWDLNRRYIPKFTTDRHENAVYCLDWQTENLFCSGGRDKYLVRSDIRYEYQPIKNLPKSSLAWPQNSYNVFFSSNLQMPNELSSHDDPFMNKGNSYGTFLPPQSDRFSHFSFSEQFSGAICCPERSSMILKALANKYALEGDSKLYLCLKNAICALEMSKIDDAQTWLFVSHACHRNESGDDRWLDNLEFLKQDKFSDVNYSGGLNLELILKYPLFSRSKMEQLVNETDDEASLDSESESFTRKKLPRQEAKFSFDLDLILKMAIDQLANHGEVQMAASLAIIFGSWYQRLFPRRYSDLCLSYLYLLHANHLFLEAMAIIPSIKDEKVTQKFTEEVTLRYACSECNHKLGRSDGSESFGWYCQNCKKVSLRCEICRRTVRALSFWCHSCSHGGHLQCYLVASKTHLTKCPAPNCIHRCQF